MRHRILTCRNHTDLRWSCKDVAWSGFYNGCRNLRFNGIPSGRGMFSDGSGLSCTCVQNETVVQECACPSSDLILAPEDALVKEY